MSRWTDRYLIERMGERKISIAVTPTGRADAITQGPDGRLFFAEPHVETMTMGRFLEMLHNGQTRGLTYPLTLRSEIRTDKANS